MSTNSPRKQIHHSTSSNQLRSAQSSGRLRKLQSAHQLSATFAAGASSGAAPLSSSSTLAQPRQLRHPSGTLPPPVPSIPAQHSPSPKKLPRARADSDVEYQNQAKRSASPRRHIVSKKTNGPRDAKLELETLIRQGPRGDTPLALENLRHWILCDGMEADGDGMSHLRIYVWLILQNAPAMPTDSYLDLTRRGPSPAHAKICNDTFRTFKTNPLFKRRVTDNSLIRLLNAVAWRLHDDQQRRKSSTARSYTHGMHHQISPRKNSLDPFTDSMGAMTIDENLSDAGGSASGIYVQGMNVLCAPFLYVARSEAQAFAAFYSFITEECPAYVRGAMDGVHKGVALVDRCLAIVDPKLSAHLISRGVKAEVYAFASVLTMCAGTPPLPEVLLLWDFLLAYGAHLNILCICAQLMIIREQLLAEASPGRLLRTFPALDAKKVIMLTVGLVSRIPEDLHEELIHHAQ